MLMKHCKRCGVAIVYPLTYCPTCQVIVDEYREQQRVKYKRDADRKYNAKRDPKYVRFYNSSEWRTLSAKRLLDDGYRCVMCGKIATEVDHIIEIQTPQGWELRLDYDNTRSLCHACHDKRHKRFEKRKRRPQGRP